MRLHQIPDWTRVAESLGRGSVLKNAKSSTLRHFIILEVEDQGSSQLRLLEVGPDMFERILAALKTHAGRAIEEIAQMEIGG
ncbi:MAG TPA: hypothetical protein VGL70_16195 [Candidatus Binatia bacterium]|jgi:hypothetical protein